jgi:elongation factor 1-gamma
MLHFPEGKRNNLIPNITRWFNNIMNTKECIKAYGKTILCKTPVKPFINKININKEKNKGNNINNNKKNEKEQKSNNNNNETKTKKEINPLDALPPSKFILEDFKRSFLNDKNKSEAIKNFWESFESTRRLFLLVDGISKSPIRRQNFI